TALSTTLLKRQKRGTPYKKEFKNGATIYPRAFFFVELDQELPPDFHDRVVNVRTSASAKEEGKGKWKQIPPLGGRMESRFLFRTARAKSVLPFALVNPDLVALPLVRSLKGNKRHLSLMKSSELLEQGFIEASKWFRKAEQLWDRNKTEK